MPMGRHGKAPPLGGQMMTAGTLMTRHTPYLRMDKVMAKGPMT
jgi:hypothetical protein